jgi:perosamine synthetase
MIKLAKPVICENAIQDVVEILRSGNLVQGPYVKQFEKALQNYLKIDHAVAVSSGTAALHLALMALSLHEGDEVIVPAFTFPATANVVESVGAKPVLVDISLDDFCLDPSQIEAVITKKTKAIMVVHEFGQAADMEKILDVAKKHKLYLIEDAACAMGTRLNNQPVGTFGTLGCFSFHPRKVVTTGEGGAVTAGDDMLAAKIMSLRNHGQSSVGTADFMDAGLNYRMTDFQAAIGYHQLLNIENDIERRIQLAEKYRKNLSACNWLTTPGAFENRRHNYQTFHLLLHDGLDRNQFISNLKAYGIEANLGAQALHVLPFYKRKYDYGPSDFPRAFKAWRQGLALPMGPHLSNENIDYICDHLHKIYQIDPSLK